MPHWLLKSALQRVVSMLPHRQKWNELFQKFGTRSLDIGTGQLQTRLEHTRTHLDNFLKFQDEGNPTSNEFTVLELGTGWYPWIALGLRLCGAGEIWTIDIDPLLRSERIGQLVRLLCEFDDQKKLQILLPHAQRKRIDQLREWADLADFEPPEQFLKRFNIHVLVGDAQKTSLPSGSIDLFCSTGVLEYLPPPVFRGILAEFRRLGSPKAIMSHWVSLIDQFSYFDRSITPFNFLKYTQRQWRYLNSPLIWQNRMRINDYRTLLSEGGYQILQETNVSGKPEDLATIRLAPEFQSYATEDLLVLTSWLVAKPIRG